MLNLFPAKAKINDKAAEIFSLKIETGFVSIISFLSETADNIRTKRKTKRNEKSKTKRNAAKRS